MLKEIQILSSNNREYLCSNKVWEIVKILYYITYIYINIYIALVNSQDYEKKNSGQNKNLDSFDTAKYNSNETSSYLTKKYQDNLALVDTTPQ